MAATLAQLDQDTRSVKVGLEQQKAAVDGELHKVEEALEDVRRGERTRKEEMDKIVREVESLKRDMPKVSSWMRKAWRRNALCHQVSDPLIDMLCRALSPPFTAV